MILLIGCYGSAAVAVEETEPSTSTFSNRENQQGPSIHATAPLSVKIPRLDLQCVDMKVRNEHIARSDDRLRCIPRIRPSAMGKLVAAAGRQSEGLVAIGEAEIARQVEQLMGNEMNDLPALLEQRRPDDKVGGTGLVLDGDEHEAFWIPAFGARGQGRPYRPIDRRALIASAQVMRKAIGCCRRVSPVWLQS